MPTPVDHLRALIDSVKLRAILGQRQWGRQPPIKLHVTTRARVIRTNGEVEDLGIVDQRKV